MRRMSYLALWIIGSTALAACQTGPGQPMRTLPGPGQTLPVTETPAIFEPSPTVRSETAAATTESAETAPTETLAPSPVDASVAPRMMRYMNREFGYQIDIPAESMINSDQPDLVRIDLPSSARTNLSEKYLEISVAGGQTGCSSPYARGYDPAALQRQTLIINGNEFLVESASEGAAGSIYEFVSYSTQKDDVCLSLSFVLHSLNAGVFNTPPAEFDPLAEKALFETIVQIFVWSAN